MTFQLRPFRASDADGVTQAAVAAFAEFAAIMDHPTAEDFAKKVRDLAESGEMIVAATPDRIAGCVTYVAPGAPKQDWFDREWPVIRMLVVHPDSQGLGIGRALVEECVSRARRDGGSLIALHTSPRMTAAMAMYERMGFEFVRESPPRGGAPYGVWAKRLTGEG